LDALAAPVLGSALGVPYLDVFQLALDFSVERADRPVQGWL